MNGFDIRKFKSMDGFNSQNRYAERYLDILGEGSSRVVYYLSSRYVLKISNSAKRGPPQNKAEVDVYTMPGLRPVVAAIYDFDDKNYNWVISEVVREIHSNDEFEELTGIDWYMFQDFIELKLPLDAFIEKRLEIVKRQLKSEENSKHAGNRGSVMWIKQLKEQIEELESLESSNTFLNAVGDLTTKTSLIGGDMSVLKHWGKTADGRVVLLDYGFTEEVLVTAYR